MIDVSMQSTGAWGDIHVNAVSEAGRAYFTEHFGFAAVSVTLNERRAASNMLSDMKQEGLVVEVDGIVD
jgi:hypothetical protein